MCKIKLIRVVHSNDTREHPSHGHFPPKEQLRLVYKHGHSLSEKGGDSGTHGIAALLSRRDLRLRVWNGQHQGGGSGHTTEHTGMCVRRQSFFLATVYNCQVDNLEKENEVTVCITAVPCDPPHRA